MILSSVYVRPFLVLGDPINFKRDRSTKSGTEFDPHIWHILSWRLGHEKISTAIVPLMLIQEEQLSVTGELMCTKYWKSLPRRLAQKQCVRVTDCTRNDLKCVEGPYSRNQKPKLFHVTNCQGNPYERSKV